MAIDRRKHFVLFLHELKLLLEVLAESLLLLVLVAVFAAVVRRGIVV